MSTFINPAIVKSGLVLAFDAANGASYRGEATTNLIPTPSVNALPTTGNGWGTYNTNQYGSGTFFSIGTVSSVSSNVVTMTGNHGLRTYDVMRPQTTGGGVTANTDYFIKRISDTQFTIHNYNSSQDGSQGYISSSTGYHKVHDNIANDTRVSVNSTNFPTMWWGAPHLPNSGLVKELITKGFNGMPGYDPTDCLRQHVTRPVGADHMAYNVDASVTIGSPVVSSFWARAVNQNAVGKTINFYHYNYGGVSGADAFSVNCTLGEVGVWQRYTLGFTPTRNALISYWFNPDGGPYSYDIANIQIEQRSSATPFVAGTRGTTVATNGGWKDLSGNASHGETVNGPTYDSANGGSIVFDGSNDYVDFSAGTLGGTATVEMWVKLGAGYAGRMFFGWLYYDVWCPSGHLGYNTGNGDCYGITSTVVSNLGLVGNWNHYVFEMRSDVAYTNNKIYINGVEQSIGQVQSSESSGNRNFNSGNGRISSWRGSVDYIIPMNCSTFRVYNGSLTASQVLQNFNATRARFGV